MHGYFPHDDPMNIQPKGFALFVFITGIMQFGFMVVKKLDFDIKQRDKRLINALVVEEELENVVSKMWIIFKEISINMKYEI